MKVRWLLLFVASVTLLTIGVRPVCAQVISRTIQISPVRMTYTDLASLVRRIHEFVGVTNAALQQDYVHERLDLRGPLTSLTLERDFSQNAFRDAPPVAYSVEYSYDLTDAPISSITISLGDLARDIRVEGRSPDQIFALEDIIAQSLGEHKTLIGGLRSRMLYTFLAVTALVVIVSIYFHSDEVVKALIPLGVVSIGLTILLDPFEKWAPGTAILSDNAPFLQAHAPLFTFIGAVTGVAAFIPALLRYLRSRVTASSTTTNKDTSGANQNGK